MRIGNEASARRWGPSPFRSPTLALAWYLAAVGAGGAGCSGIDDAGAGSGDAAALTECPGGSSKSAPGQCGCDTDDTDSDADGTADCLDRCVEDPEKTMPGQCGCREADTDGDGDGTADCVDACPDDDQRIHPGRCGCGASTTCGPHDPKDAGAACESALDPSEMLTVGKFLCSPDRTIRLTLGDDGRLTLKDGSEVLFSACCGVRAVMQGDGNFVLYDKDGKAQFDSKTVGGTRTVLNVENNGTLVLRRDGVVVWTKGRGVE